MPAYTAWPEDMEEHEEGAGRMPEPTDDAIQDDAETYEADASMAAAAHTAAAWRQGTEPPGAEPPAGGGALSRWI